LQPNKEDGWSIYMAEKDNICCHFEDSITLFEDKLIRITGE